MRRFFLGGGSGAGGSSESRVGLKRVFHKLETYGGQCLQIPVFTGMTGFTAVLRIDRRVDVVNRRAMYGLILERRLLKQALETRPYRRFWGCGGSVFFGEELAAAFNDTCDAQN